MEIQSWKVRFIPPRAEDGSKASPVPQAGLPKAEMEAFEFESTSNLPTVSSDELLLVAVPTAAEITAPVQRELEAWARSMPAGGDPVIEASVRTARAICSSHRAVLFADEHRADAADGLVRMLNIHRELMGLEADVADRLSRPSAPAPDKRSAAMELKRTTEMKLTYLRLRNASERPNRQATIRSQRLFLELATTAQIPERLDAAAEPIQTIHELAEAAQARASDRSHFLISTLAEAVIALLLAVDLLWLILQ